MRWQILLIKLFLVVMNILLHFPAATIAITATVVSGALVAVVRKWVGLHLLTSHHEVAFPIFLQIGVIYAVLLAFIFSVVLNNIGDAYKEVKEETTNVLTLAQLAPGLPPATREAIDDALINYIQIIIHDEWPKMAKGQEDINASKTLWALEKVYLNFNPQSPREEAIYTESLHHLNILRENRRMRMFTATQPRLNFPLAFLCILGAIVISISYLFGMKHLWTQMLLTGALTFTISAILTITFILSEPFSGKFAITPRVFETTLMRLQQISHEN